MQSQSASPRSLIVHIAFVLSSDPAAAPLRVCSLFAGTVVRLAAGVSSILFSLPCARKPKKSSHRTDFHDGGGSGGTILGQICILWSTSLAMGMMFLFSSGSARIRRTAIARFTELSGRIVFPYLRLRTRGAVYCRHTTPQLTACIFVRSPTDVPPRGRCEAQKRSLEFQVSTPNATTARITQVEVFTVQNDIRRTKLAENLSFNLVRLFHNGGSPDYFITCGSQLSSFPCPKVQLNYQRPYCAHPAGHCEQRIDFESISTGGPSLKIFTLLSIRGWKMPLAAVRHHRRRQTLAKSITR